MELRKDEYRIEDDGIWIKKEVLESWRDHYLKVVKKVDYNPIMQGMYIGKADVFTDLLKMFEPLEGL